MASYAILKKVAILKKAYTPNLEDGVSINNATNVAWEIKIQSCSLVTIVLYRNDIHELAISLQQKLAQTPRFFHETPIILAFTDEAEAI